ncbi:hypothetical protein OHC33_006338 [Knufia fluminis]|uniref:Probable beta-glucosidase G n=1 Tax=Knufia fluminis TaxID=191047 RepID=A0AAN8I866_9EURO|nr:hypothetical protein OHC33_006338 [Knufia fluminis]
MLLSLFASLLAVVHAQNGFDGGPYFTSPETYPSPNITGAGGWEAALAKANAFLAQLNLTEKAYMVTGADGACVGTIAPIARLNFSGLCLQDGPAAIRQADLASAFPAGLTAAATWDKALIYQRGIAMAEEFRGKGSHIALGPVVGPLGRHALGGRNWEGFSPDPYLTGMAAASTVEAMQSVGVQATIKHFIGNEQEIRRNPATSPNGTTVAAVTSNIDDRTMHQLYLWPFADTVKSGVASVMCSYQRINQTYGCQNSKTQNGLLKGELGFQGYVMSDWGATHASIETVLGGLDMDMPGSLSFSATGTDRPSFFGGNLTALVQNGTIPESRLDDMVRRIMTPYYYLGQDQGFPTVDPSTEAVSNARSNRYQLPIVPARDVRANHAGLIKVIGSAGTVLLKNTNNTLPLDKPANIAVFGNDAPDVTSGLAVAANSSIGTLMLGGGSGTARATYVVSPLSALLNKATQDGTRVQYVTDNNEIARGNLGGLYPLPDVCLVFLKTYAGEGNDRSLFTLDYNSTAVMSQITSVCSNTVVVTHSVGINTMPWADNPNVTAILAAHLPGQESGNSIVDILYGAVNPSGKLPYTIARNESDYNAPILNLTGTPHSYNGDAWQSDFTEGLMIDYRHFDNAGIEPLFEFGHGLSYSTFSLQDLTVQAVSGNTPSTPPATDQLTPGGNPALWENVVSISVTVSNTGNVAGATVVQLYLSMPQDSVPSGTPTKVLRGFEKVLLQPGESSTVQLPLRRRDVSYWDVVSQEWLIPSGEFSISVGFSSRDLQANGPVWLVES